MKTVRLLASLLFAMLCLPWAVAQQDGNAVLGEWLEQWADQFESESVPDDLVERLATLLDNPMNLNDTASVDWNDFPFLSDFQREVLRAYIEQNGEMLSLAELHLLNGFDSLTIRRMAPFVTVAPVAHQERQSLRQLLAHGHGNLRVGGKMSWPLSRAYEEDIYAGSPLRLYFRYRFHCADKIVFQLSADKDPGEPFLHHTPLPGFDYYGFYLMLNNMGIVKRAIVGKYHLQFGQGATLWSGFAPWMSGNMALRRYGQGIRPASAFCEYGYLQGAAATLQVAPHTEITAFYSLARRDATAAPSDTSLSGEDYLQSLYESGYHRTDNEMSKRNNLVEQLFGTHIQYRRQSLQLGATAYALHFDKAVVPAPNVYNTYAFRGADNFNVGIDATYRFRRLMVFGEAALAFNDSLRPYWSQPHLHPFAAVAGMMLHLNANNVVSVAYRYGAPTYQNRFANTLGQSDSPQNESGVTLMFNTRLPFFIDMRSSVDFFRFPWFRYRIYSPSSGVDYRLALSKAVAPYTILTAQFRLKSAQRNSDGMLYATERTWRRQLNFSLDYSPSQSLRLLSRLLLTWFDCEEHAPQRGFLMSQEASLKWARLTKPLSATLRLALFDVSAYDARIFAYESDLMYEFAVPMLTGRGIRGYLVVRQDWSDQWSWALKYAVSFYPDKESLGSGYDVVPGHMKHEIKAQIRWRF